MAPIKMLDKTEMSFYTLHLYLNESDPNGPDGELIGGGDNIRLHEQLE